MRRGQRLLAAAEVGEAHAEVIQAHRETAGHASRIHCRRSTRSGLREPDEGLDVEHDHPNPALSGRQPVAV